MRFALLVLGLQISSLSVLPVTTASAAAAAAESPRDIALTCVTEWPTTSFGIFVDQEKEQLVARVIHHNGSRFAPAINGVFTPYDIPILSQRAALVEKMKDVTTFRWPLARCKNEGGMRFQCFGTDDIQEGKNGEKLHPFALYTTLESEDGIAGHLEYVSVRLSFDVDGKGDPSIEMKYPRSNCVPVVKEIPLR